MTIEIYFEGCVVIVGCGRLRTSWVDALVRLALMLRIGVEGEICICEQYEMGAAYFILAQHRSEI